MMSLVLCSFPHRAVPKSRETTSTAMGLRGSSPRLATPSVAESWTTRDRSWFLPRTTTGARPAGLELIPRTRRVQVPGATWPARGHRYNRSRKPLFRSRRETRPVLSLTHFAAEAKLHAGGASPLLQHRLVDAITGSF